jgi:hypothetical protein
VTPSTLTAVRLSHFRELMEGEFGPVRAASLSRDHVFAELDGQTVEQAIESGFELRRIWRAVCQAYEVPATRR